MITVTDLTFAYPGQSPVFSNLSFTVRSGTHVALMGPNGSGKTTLALLLKGLLSPATGFVSVDGFRPDNEESRFEVMKRVGLVFQNPDNTIVATTVEREIAFGLENLGVSPDEMESRVDEVLERFDLERYRHTNPANLSGGEKQRCALAAVMVMRPALLILDEPTSLLDPSSRNRILRYIRESVACDATVIHVTPFVEEARLADSVIVLDESGIYETGPPEEVLKGTTRFRTCGVVNADVLRDAVPQKKSADNKISHAHRESRNHSHNSLLASLENVIHTYDRGTPYENRALDGITMCIPAGTSTVLLGSSGSGKTTLLEIIAGVTAQTGGTVQFEGNPLRAMAFQFPEDQMFGETVESYVSFGPRNIGVCEPELSVAVERTLDAVGLEPSRYRGCDPLSLSGGEKRRAALAGVLAMSPDVLILDEPFSGLDRQGMELILRFLQEYLDSGGTLIFSTHDFEVVWRLADFAAVLGEGRLETYGIIENVFGESKWIKKSVKCEV